MKTKDLVEAASQAANYKEFQDLVVSQDEKEQADAKAEAEATEQAAETIEGMAPSQLLTATLRPPLARWSVSGNG